MDDTLSVLPMAVPLTGEGLAHERRASPAAMLHASNLLTYGALLCGLAAVTAALWYRSVAGTGMAIALAVVADTFDGRWASRFRRSASEREFGAQLDSLVDAISSGLVPVAVTMALLQPQPGWNGVLLVGCAFGYVVSVVTRLGFYNLTHAAPADERAHFVGLPAPVAAMCVATMLLWPLSALAAAAVLACCGVVMIAGFRIQRPTGKGMAVFVAWPVVVFAAHALSLL